MLPIEVLSRLFKVSPKIAAFILAGMGIFAAAAIVLSFGSDFADLSVVAIYLVVFATVASVFALILNDGLMRATLCWIFIAAFGGWTAGLFDAALQVSQRLPSLPCYIRMPIEHPQVCEARLAPTVTVIGGQQDAALPTPERLWFAQTDPVWPPAPVDTELATNTLIYIQFTPDVPRDRVIDLATNLGALNWQIEGAPVGGEEVAKGPSQNEVRFFHIQDSAAAVALAESLYALNPDAPVSVRDFTRLGRYAKNGQLEIWVNALSEQRLLTNQPEA
jgi:hypothetical protein